MTVTSIIGKLDALLNTGVTTEAQVVYLMAAVRKLLEQRPPDQDEVMTFDYLKFYCDWTLHSELNGRMAQRILRLFEAANLELKAGGELRNLPDDLNRQIEFISKMTYFERELTRFLEINGLPSLDVSRPDGFAHFLHLYAEVIEDCPLVMSAKNTTASVDNVTIRVDFAKASPADGGEMFYRVNWIVSDKNRQSGNISVINSFSLEGVNSMTEVKSVRLVGYDAVTGKQVFALPNYALTHSISVGFPTLGIEPTVLIVGDIPWKVVGVVVEDAPDSLRVSVKKE